MFENSNDIGHMADIRGEGIRSRVEHYRRVRECRGHVKKKHSFLTALAGGGTIFTAIEAVLNRSRRRK